MRVLLLTHRIPFPPDKGDKIRSFRMLKALASRHDVRLVTHADDPSDLRHVPALESMCGSVSVHPVSRPRRLRKSAGALFRGRPLSFARFHERAAAAEVAAVLAAGAADVVVAVSAQPAEYLPDPVGVPVVVDLVDVDSEKWAGYAAASRGPWRLLMDREARLVRAFERRLAERGFHIALVTEREAALFRRVVADVPVTVLPNGVDLPPPELRREPAPGLLVFVGAMDYAANREAARIAAEEVLPAVRRAVPGAGLRIVGRNPGSLTKTLGRLPGVEVTGGVVDVGAELARASLSMMPLRTVRGIPNKLLEAFAWGLPVVATPEALDAAGASDGVHALSGESPEDLAVAAVALLREPERARRIGEAGRELVRERFRWDRFDAGVLALVGQCAAAEARA